MASTGRHSELQALVFDLQFIQFKLKGAGVTLYFTPKFMRKYQRRNQVNDPYIPAVTSGKQDFGAPNFPVRALRYYHRYMTEHPESKRKHCLFLPFKENMRGRSSVQPLSLVGSAHHSGHSCHPLE